jgi:hypothetical protein
MSPRSTGRQAGLPPLNYISYAPFVEHKTVFSFRAEGQAGRSQADRLTSLHQHKMSKIQKSSQKAGPTLSANVTFVRFRPQNGEHAQSRDTLR